MVMAFDGNVTLMVELLFESDHSIHYIGLASGAEAN